MIEAGHDHTLPLVGQQAAHIGNGPVEELYFVDCHYFGIRLYQAKDFMRVLYHHGIVTGYAVVRSDAFQAIAVVQARFEDLNLLARNFRAANTAQ